MIDLSAGPRRLHPVSVFDNVVKAAPGALIGMVGAFAVLIQRNPGLAIMVAAGVLLVSLLGAGIGWWRFSYDIRPGEIVIEKGLLSRQRRVIPFDRVRDIAIEQPLLARLFGTARVRIETGGARNDEGVLDMVTLAQAQALRDLVRDTHRGLVAASEDDVPVAEPVIFAMPLGRVLGFGLLSFSLIFIAVAFGALQYLDDLGIVDFGRLIASQSGGRAAGLLTVRNAAIILALLLVLGLVSGVVRTLLRDYGFTLTIGATGLRRRRGLLTLSEVVIPARRIEAARIDTGLVAGLLGWHGLAFQTLGADQKEGGVQAAAPFARAEEVAAVLAEAGVPPLPGERLIRPPLTALMRRILPWLACAVVASLLIGTAPYVGWAALGFGLIALARAAAWLRAGHLAGAQALYLRGGLFTRRLWIVPYGKLQLLATRRGPLQRLFGLASLAPDTAGAPAFGPPAAELGLADAQALAARLLADFYAARARAKGHAVI